MCIFLNIKPTKGKNANGPQGGTATAETMMMMIHSRFKRSFDEGSPASGLITYS